MRVSKSKFDISAMLVAGLVLVNYVEDGYAVAVGLILVIVAIVYTILD